MLLSCPSGPEILLKIASQFDGLFCSSSSNNSKRKNRTKCSYKLSKIMKKVTCVTKISMGE